MKVLKLIAAIFSGLMLGTVVIFILETLSHALYPLPQGLDFTNSQAVEQAMQNAPTGALVLVVAAYAIGSFLAGMVAHLIGRMPKQIDAWITGLLLMAIGAFNLLTITHPLWMVILGIGCFLPAALCGSWLVRKKTTEHK